jgi:hypothetical protein
MTRVITGEPLAPLTAEEALWLAYWRQMDDRRREENMAFVELQAKRYPRRDAPSLTLVARGAP